MSLHVDIGVAVKAGVVDVETITGFTVLVLVAAVISVIVLVEVTGLLSAVGIVVKTGSVELEAVIVFVRLVLVVVLVAVVFEVRVLAIVVDTVVKGVEVEVDVGTAVLKAAVGCIVVTVFVVLEGTPAVGRVVKVGDFDVEATVDIVVLKVDCTLDVRVLLVSAAELTVADIADDAEACVVVFRV